MVMTLGESPDLGLRVFISIYFMWSVKLLWRLLLIRTKEKRDIP